MSEQPTTQPPTEPTYQPGFITPPPPHPPSAVYTPLLPPAAPIAPRNGFGITSLVLALVGLVFSLVPFTGFIALICGGLALLFGLLGFGRTRRGEATNKKMALIGAGIGALALVVGVIGMVILFQATDKLANDLKNIGQPHALAPAVTAPSVPSSPATFSYTAPAAPAVEQPAPAAEPPAVPGPAPVTFTDGEYVVGTDIPPGTYKTQGNPDGTSCYWARHKNDGGAAGPVITGGNHIGNGPTSFRARQGEVMELSLGCTYTKVQ